MAQKLLILLFFAAFCFSGVGNSDSCEVNINCFPEWIKPGGSVVKMIRNETICNGTFVNNSLFDGRKLLLTQAHCFQHYEIGDTFDVRLVFNFESVFCDSTVLSDWCDYYGPVEVIAQTSDGNDFQLLEVLDSCYIPLYSYL